MYNIIFIGNLKKSFNYSFDLNTFSLTNNLAIVTQGIQSETEWKPHFLIILIGKQKLSSFDPLVLKSLDLLELYIKPVFWLIDASFCLFIDATDMKLRELWQAYCYESSSNSGLDIFC